MSERKKKILDFISEHPDCSVTALAEAFDVSAVTIRGDLSALEEDGLLIRSHGGAIPAFHPDIVQRVRSAKPTKTAIAKAAADAIHDGDTIIIAAGTTTALIPRFLRGRRNVHIVTNNTLLLTHVRTNPLLKVTLVGGEFQPDEEALTGPITLNMLDQFHVDRAFIGIDGASEEGFFANSIESATFVRTMTQRADEIIVLADSSKFANPGFAHILPLEAVHQLITNKPLPQPIAEIVKNTPMQINIIENKGNKHDDS